MLLNMNRAAQRQHQRECGWRGTKAKRKRKQPQSQPAAPAPYIDAQGRPMSEEEYHRTVDTMTRMRAMGFEVAHSILWTPQ